MSDEDFVRVLRATLSDRADEAPDPQQLIARVLAATADDGAPAAAADLTLHAPTSADRSLARVRRRRMTRLLAPLAAAASVAAVVGLGLAVTHDGGSRASSNSGAGGGADSRETAAPAQTRTEAGAASADAGETSAPTSAPSVQSTTSPVSSGFQVLDLTFFSPTSAYAVGTVPCTAGRCTILARSSGASMWQVASPSVPFTVSGAGGGGADQVTHIRFANSAVGYAYGGSAVFATTDGGVSWTRSAVATNAVEVAGSTAVSIQTRSCSGTTCGYEINTSTPGSLIYTPAAVPARIIGTGVLLARAGDRAFVAVQSEPAATIPSDYVLSSADGGYTWTQAAVNVCATTAEGAASGSSTASPSASPSSTSSAVVVSELISLAAAADGSVTALCSSPAGQFVTVSADGGRSFTAGAVTDRTGTTVSSASAKVLVIGGSTLTRSTDGGRTWAAVAGVPALGSTRWLGFEDTTHGAWIGGNATSIWSTTDGGASYSEYAFG